MRVVERVAPVDGGGATRAVEYTGAIALDARNRAEFVGLRERERQARGPRHPPLRCSAAERSMPARTVPSSTDENTATETPTTTASTGTSPALGSRSDRADPRKGTSLQVGLAVDADQPGERNRVEAEHDDARHERQQQRHGREQRVDAGLRGGRGEAAAQQQHHGGGREEHDEQFADPAEAAASRPAEVGPGPPERAQRGRRRRPGVRPGSRRTRRPAPSRPRRRRRRPRACR